MSDTQVDDLVNRLREPSNSSVTCKLLCLNAADEIERLRSALETSARGRREFQALCREMLARVEKIP